MAGITKLFILYDGDKPGIKAAEKLSEALAEFITVEVLELKNDLDPGKMSQKQTSNIVLK